MKHLNAYGFEMTLISEVYLSTLSAIMTPHGLERFFVPMLYLAEHSGTITQKDLGAALKRDKVFTMRIVDSLSQKGLLERKQDCNDRRCQLLELTPKGSELIPKIKEAIKETNRLLFQDFPPEERVIFENGMGRLMDRLATLPAPNFMIQAHERDNDE